MEKDNETSNSRDFVTTSEAAEALGVSYYTVYEYIKEKRLVAEMVGGIYMIPEESCPRVQSKANRASSYTSPTLAKISCRS